MKVLDKLTEQIKTDYGNEPGGKKLLDNLPLLDNWLHKVSLAMLRIRRAGAGSLVASCTSGWLPDGEALTVSAVISLDDKPKFLLGTSSMQPETTPTANVAILLPVTVTEAQRLSLRAVPGELAVVLL